MIVFCFQSQFGYGCQLESRTGTGLGVGPRTVPSVSAGVCVSFGLRIRMVVEYVLVLVLVPVLVPVYVFGYLQFSSRRI